MSKFDPVSNHQFWYHFPDTSVYRIVTFMEGQEDWTLDGNPAVESAIQKLENALDNIDNIDLALEGYIIPLIAHIKTGRGLHILMYIDQAYSGSANKIIAQAEKKASEGDQAAQLFQKRNLVFERLRLLHRVFQKDHMAMINDVLS